MFIQSPDSNSFSLEYGIKLRRLYPNKHIGRSTPFGSSWGIVNPSESTSPHSHHEDESFYIIDGEGRMQIDEQLENVKTGDVIFIPAHSTHQLTNLQADKDLQFISIWWEKGD
ncbi:cupin domain-containing protein [Priestia aryabhattai]|uniref:cupin domain-containing protein n=1 Tax=Priestia TaxID=2800373 RepID=UPI002D7F6ED1|nr:cupin domain-containing protein [Priestia megaterium]MEB4887686.1 cupin domain-containing protein [Priestia megaterium]